MITKEQFDEAVLLSMSEEEAQAYVESIRAEIISKEIVKNMNLNLGFKRFALAAYGIGSFNQWIKLNDIQRL